MNWEPLTHFFLSCLLWNRSDTVWGKERVGVTYKSTKICLRKRVKFYASKGEEARDKKGNSSHHLLPLQQCGMSGVNGCSLISTVANERRETPPVLCSVSCFPLAPGQTSLCLLKCKGCVWKTMCPWRVLTQGKLKSLLQKILPVLWHWDGLCMQRAILWLHLECLFVSRSLDSCSEGLEPAVRIFLFRMFAVLSFQHSTYKSCNMWQSRQGPKKKKITGSCPVVFLLLENTSSWIQYFPTCRK